MDSVDYRRERKAMLRAFFPLLVAIALQQMLALTVNLVDNFMLGAYSEQAMSGAALVNQLQFILQQVMLGIGGGVSVLGAQYWGKKETEPIKRIISVGLKVGVLAGAVMLVITTVFPENIMSFLSVDKVIVAEACEYLSIMRFTYVIYGASAVLMYSMMSVETAFIGTVMSAMTIGINSILNYTFIFGNFGAPEMGIQGAAYATLVSRIVELVTIVLYIRFKDKKLKAKIHELLRFDFEYLRDYIKVAMPVMISGLLWGFANLVQTALLGNMAVQAAEVIGANSIATVVFQLFGAFGFSCTNAGSVIIGKTVGSGRPDLVKKHAKTLQLVFILIGAIICVALLIFKDMIIGAYNVSDATRSLASSFLTILAVTSIGTCYEFPVSAGIIAGGGNTKYAPIVDMLFMWLWTIPSAYVSAYVFGWAPVITFIFLKSDQFLKCIPNAIVCNRFKWIRDLTR